MRLQKFISNLNPEQLRVGPYRMVRLSHARSIPSLQWSEIDGIFVESEAALREVLLNDRSYLKPVFFLGETKRQCDGNYTNVNDLGIIRKMEVLLQSISKYEHLSLPADRDQMLLTKMARYLISRNTAVDPINSRTSKIGYSYPLVEDMSIESDPIHILKHLRSYSSQDYFQAQIIDKVNVCYECQGSFLNFSECCTKCNSLDLKSEELVHHFRCAYVGPQSDFIKDQKLVCPKCDHQLKHIGIDYDKPSEIHTCKSCNHSSQETKMKAKCVDCCKENELDQLTTFEISAYKPTEKLKALASKENEAQSFGQIKSDTSSPFLNMGAFNLLKSHESKRGKTHDLDTYEMTLSINSELLATLNSGMCTALAEELAFIIKPYLNDHDLLALDEYHNINTLLINYEQSMVAQVKEVLHYNLNKMLKDNGWGDAEMISITTNPITR